MEEALSSRESESPSVRPACCGVEMEPVGWRIFACRWCRSVAVKCPACSSTMRPDPDGDGWVCHGCGGRLHLPDAALARLAGGVNGG